MTGKPIVVGVDGSPGGLRALDLAVHEARLRELPLRVVYANSWARHPAWVDTDPHGPVAQRLGIEPRRAVDAALDRIPAGITAQGVMLIGSPTSVLVHESQSASVLVVGHRGRGGFPGLALGSVAGKVAIHAGCPVLIARGQPAPDGPVLVGVDGAPVNEPAIGFGFEEAALRGADLAALHTWVGPASTGPGDMLPLVYDPAVIEAQESVLLSDALAGWQVKYPDVVVRRRLLRSRAAGALVEASRHAQLVVLGAHRRNTPTVLGLGSVSHALMHHADCPVAIVRPAPGSAASIRSAYG
ncbi:MAG: hypothetical protein AUG44_09420 [Actinobacteria bacterium 13_1_20CM_3_71_11]|nr:MAG: hypothetical protein AUG44_09420 [Actinobacteria bacterium 13_1_20CM_3_71_11]